MKCKQCGKESEYIHNFKDLTFCSNECIINYIKETIQVYKGYLKCYEFKKDYGVKQWNTEH